MVKLSIILSTFRVSCPCCLKSKDSHRKKTADLSGVSWPAVEIVLSTVVYEVRNELLSSSFELTCMKSPKSTQNNGKFKNLQFYENTSADEYSYSQKLKN